MNDRIGACEPESWAGYVAKKRTTNFVVASDDIEQREQEDCWNERVHQRRKAKRKDSMNWVPRKHRSMDQFGCVQQTACDLRRSGHGEKLWHPSRSKGM